MMKDASEHRRPPTPAAHIEQTRADPVECLRRFDLAFEENLKLHERYMIGAITFEEYRTYSAEAAVIKAQMLQGCKIVRRN